MSDYRRDPAYLAGDIIGAGLLMAGAIALMVGMAIAQLLRTPTEEKLRRLTPPETWGEVITGQPCPHCRTYTETGSYCQGCGQALA